MKVKSKMILFAVVICLFTVLIVTCSAPTNDDYEERDNVQTIKVMMVKDNEPIEEINKEETNEETNVFDNKETDVFNNEVEPTFENEVEPEIEPNVRPVFYLSDDERRIAECIVMGESGSESYEGQVLVSQCLLNACLKDELQPSEVRTKYKYAGWNDNPSDSVKNAVSAVFDNGYKVTDEFILYFYAPKYSKGRWHETQRFITEVGGHRFFAEWDE